LPDLAYQRITDLLSDNARNIFSLSQPVIRENEVADLTLFTKEGSFVYDLSAVKSKSKNSPFINRQLNGKVIGIINKDRVYLNE